MTLSGRHSLLAPDVYSGMSGFFCLRHTGMGRFRFHGPGHGEAFGTFDTGAYVGAFGARRVP